MSADNLSNAASNRRNLTLFALLCAAALGGVIAYALFSRDPAKLRHPSNIPSVPEAGQQRVEPSDASNIAHVVEDDQQLAKICRQPHLLIRNTAPGSWRGRLMVVPLEATSGPRCVTPLIGERVYGMGKAGVCLKASQGIFTKYQCVSFDDRFQVLNIFKLAGIPSRARVSRDGRMAAFTAFATGDSYSTKAGFSTRTTILNLKSATVIGDLEEFSVQKNGQPFKAVDFNFWGITFAKDSDQFYATLGTGGKMFLVEGRVSFRSITILQEGIECPSLSPDGTRVIYKSRTMEGKQLAWRLYVLHLDTKSTTVVNELRSVDDQCEWLDNDRVLYALPRGAIGGGDSDIWVSQADGSGDPRVFVADASSPCVVRP